MMLRMADLWLQKADELEHAGTQRCAPSRAPLAPLRQDQARER